MHEVVGREQDLPDHHVVRAEQPVHALEQTGLTDRGDRLERSHVAGRRQPERGHARRDRARHHEHDAMAVVTGAREVVGELHERGVVELSRTAA